MNTRAFSLIIFTLCALTAIFSQSNEPTAPHLSAAKKVRTFTGAIWTNDWTDKHWDNDYLVTYQQFPTKRSVAAALFDESGHMTVAASFWMEGSRETIIEDATVTSNGSLL